jgi:hypothetical protein
MLHGRAGSLLFTIVAFKRPDGRREGDEEVRGNSWLGRCRGSPGSGRVVGSGVFTLREF